MPSASPGAVPPTPVTLALIGQEGVGRSSIARCILGHDHDAQNRVIFHAADTHWAVRVISLSEADEASGRFVSISGVADVYAFVYDCGSEETFQYLPSAMHIVRKALAKKAGRPPPRPDNEPDNNPFIFAVLSNKADTPAASRQVAVSDGAAFARAGGGMFRETAARTSAEEYADDSGGPSGAIKALLCALARARSFRRTPGQAFNPNIAAMERAGAAITNAAVDTPSIRLQAAPFQDDSTEKLSGSSASPPVREMRHRKKASKDLRMSRKASHSIGGLGRDPAKFVNEPKKGCCIIS